MLVVQLKMLCQWSIYRYNVGQIENFQQIAAYTNEYSILF